MNFFTKIHELLRQKEQIVKKPDKHDANLQKNSTLYFQVGLLIALICTNVMFELYFETVPLPEPAVTVFDEEPYNVVPVIEKKPILIAMAEPKLDIKPRRLIESPIIKDNDYVEKPEKPVSVKTVEPTKLVATKPPKVSHTKTYNTMNVEQVPIFPGCEELISNVERVKCMSDKLAKIIQRKFNGDAAVDHGLEGVQRIFVQFTIDKTGHVTNVKARAPHPSLAKEAKRVMTKVPNMQPGKQSEIPVDVVYSLPIIFQVQN